MKFSLFHNTYALFLIFFLLFKPVVIAQGGSDTFLHEIDYSKIEGSPYLNDVYQSGVLTNLKGNKIKTLMIRYNLHLDRMEAKKSDGSVGALTKVDSILIKLDTKTYRLFTYSQQNGNTQKGYFIQKIGNPVCSLLQRNYKTIKEGKEAATGYHKERFPKLIGHQNYYLKFRERPAQPVKLKKKAILKAFPNHQNELNEYVSNQKLSLDNEKDLEALVNYYNTFVP